MRVNSLEVTNFRNYSHFFIDFDSDVTIFIGKNAQGKTNLIEAIYVLAVSKSFRTHINSQMILFTKEFSKIKAEIESIKNKKTLEIIIGQDFKKAKIDGKDILKTSEYVGHLNVVVFIPDDLSLIKGSPNNRRKFIDLELSKMSPIYIYITNKYHYLLKERNKYLKSLRGSFKKDDPYLDVLDEQLARLQVDIINKRREFINKLYKKVVPIYSSISSLEEKIEVTYDCFLKNENTYENIMEAYQKTRQRDIKYMQSHIGIHKDDISIKLDKKEANMFASQGQQRTIVLAMKIALIEVIKEEIGEYPILLLDDVLSELDDHRKTMLLDLLNKNIQTFITTTSIDGIDHTVIKNAKKVYISVKDREDY